MKMRRSQRGSREVHERTAVAPAARATALLAMPVKERQLSSASPPGQPSMVPRQCLQTAETQGMKADTQRKSVHSVHQEEEDSARKASIAFSQRKNELKQSGLAHGSLTHTDGGRRRLHRRTLRPTTKQARNSEGITRDSDGSAVNDGQLACRVRFVPVLFPRRNKLRGHY